MNRSVVPPPETPETSPQPPHPLVNKLLGVGLTFVSVLSITYSASSGREFYAQLMYLPILLAAFAFGLPGALLVALAAGLGLSPLLASLFGLDGLHATTAWLLRTGFFVLFAVVAGYVAGRRNRHLKRATQTIDYLSRMYARALSSLALTIEGRDERSKGHGQRVANNACVIGRALGFKGSCLETLYWGALLHDLGKIAVPEKILLKTAALSEAEFGEIKRHPGHGATLLLSVSTDLADIAQVVRSHHERWDGLGYPDGLKTDDIPLMARIVTVSDVFEALTSERPYRQPMQPKQALAYLKANSGAHFDPTLVTLFEDLFRQGEIQLPHEDCSPCREAERAPVVQTRDQVVGINLLN